MIHANIKKQCQQTTELIQDCQTEKGNRVKYSQIWQGNCLEDEVYTTRKEVHCEKERPTTKYSLNLPSRLRRKLRKSNELKVKKKDKNLHSQHLYIYGYPSNSLESFQSIWSESRRYIESVLKNLDIKYIATGLLLAER